MIKGIVFDLDGTLIRLPIRYDVIFEKLQNLFDTQDDFKPLIPTIIEKANNDTKLVQQAFDLICKEETLAANNFKVIDGAIEVLDYFKNKNYSLGLITMQCRKAVKTIFLKIKISENVFSNIITRDEFHDRFTQIKNMIEFFALSPSEVLMIGDRIHDIDSAKKAGCMGILYNEKKIGKYSEAKVVSCLSELKTTQLYLN
jgi:HAD superfamily hydrolase (TIGR01549 family)